MTEAVATRAQRPAAAVRLTSLAHGGGCGCKLSPAVLRQILAAEIGAGRFTDLLVGPETADDAAIWRLNDESCIVATTDFFMPIVDDPYDFGRIAATNAISDVYAMGARPLFALAIVGMPLATLPPEFVRQILQGGTAICDTAGIPVAGGHSIDTPEPIYGLAVVGTCHPRHVLRNTGARPGDVLILTKAIGVGVYAAALKKGVLGPHQYGELISSTTTLNAVGAAFAGHPAVHAMTDITGFGLLGHGLEMARGSNVRLLIEYARIPLFEEAEALAKRGLITGASDRNWHSCGSEVELAADCPEWKRGLLTDPQTSGGLLISCSADGENLILDQLADAGHWTARRIGHVEAGKPMVRIV